MHSLMSVKAVCLLLLGSCVLVLGAPAHDSTLGTDIAKRQDSYYVNSGDSNIATAPGGTDYQPEGNLAHICQWIGYYNSSQCSCGQEGCSDPTTYTLFAEITQKTTSGANLHTQWSKAGFDTISEKTIEIPTEDTRLIYPVFYTAHWNVALESCTVKYDGNDHNAQAGSSQQIDGVCDYQYQWCKVTFDC